MVTDDPYTEHKLSKPECPFIQQEEIKIKERSELRRVLEVKKMANAIMKSEDAPVGANPVKKTGVFMRPLTRLRMKKKFSNA